MDEVIEKCNCKSEFPAVLQHHLTENAIVCSNCNLDKEIVLTDDLKKEIIDWNHDYNIVYKNWLELDNSIEELTNPSSNLNERGLQITAKLNAIIPTYYWWHVDEGITFNNCPKCKETLMIVENEYTGKHKVCDKCKMLISE
jgi:predicted  nucleic acid-binding Zn ribbon protein